MLIQIYLEMANLNGTEGPNDEIVIVDAIVTDGKVETVVPTSVISGRPQPGQTGYVPPYAQGEKPSLFRGVDYKRWRQKMEFYISALGFRAQLRDDPPTLGENPTREQTSAVQTWNDADYMCKNIMLNGLEEKLYDVFAQGNKTTKQVWLSLDSKYNTEDAGIEKYVVDNFMEYKMVDSKTVTSQVEEFQVILGKVRSEGHEISNGFVVAALIGKLPPAWTDFKFYLKHKTKPITLEKLIAKLRVEDQNRMVHKRPGYPDHEAKANMVEHGTPSKSKDKRLKPKKEQTFKKGFEGSCYTCGKSGHRSADCRKRKSGDNKRGPAQANIVDADEDSDGAFACVVGEVNLIGGNQNYWFLDSGAMKHICSSREMFKTYQSTEEKIYMGNQATSVAVGIGKVVLKMTSGEKLALNDVLHVPDMRKNLISGSKLTKAGVKIVMEADKVVLTKAGMYLDRGYLLDGLFKMNVQTLKGKREIV